MKRLLLCLSLVIPFCHILSQEPLLPIKSESFGLNNHTNRDISYFSHIDSNKNLFVVGTTENDSTFTDVIILKLDKNHNELWRKTVSQKTDLSYDIPEKSFLSPTNELYIVGRSSLNASLKNGVIFIIKYSANGTLLYHKTIGTNDGTDYFDYDYMNANLNADGSLSLVYAPIDHVELTGHNFVFLKINNQGDILRSFTKEIINNGVIAKVENDQFYLLAKEPVGDLNSSYTFKFYNIKNENTQSNFEITDAAFLKYYENASMVHHAKIATDTDGNCYITGQNNSTHATVDKIHMAKIDTQTNVLSYSMTTSNSSKYFFVDAFVNAQNQLITVANNLNTKAIDFIHVDANNSLQTQTSPSDKLATGFKMNADGSFFLNTSNSNIRLFNNDLTELKSFDTSDSFGLSDFSKIDDHAIAVTGTSYEKMFPNSEFYTQLDIHTEKIIETQITHRYSFSGIGTSRVFQLYVIVDHDNNYLVFLNEKMGPEYLGKGGIEPPLNNRVIKFDSNLNKLWEVGIPDHIFSIVYHQNRTIDYFLDENNDLYFNLPRAGNYYGVGYDMYKLKPDGVFEFMYNSHFADLFHRSGDRIFMASNYFIYEDSTKLTVLHKENGNILNVIDLGHEKVLNIFSIGSDTYFYTYEAITNNTPDFFHLYKNGVKLFTRNLEHNYGIYPMEVDAEGSLFFVTDSGPDRRLNKLDINNSYTFYESAVKITGFKQYLNGTIFVALDNGHSLILDEDLNFLSHSEAKVDFQTYLKAWGNYMLLGTGYQKTMTIIDEQGDIVNYFQLQSMLDDTALFDKKGNLIMVGNFGNRIYIFNEYAWYRGYIHSYGTLESLLSLEDFADDLTKNNVLIYPNPTSNILNIKVKHQNIQKVMLFNLSGKLLKTYTQSSIDLRPFDTGLYLIKILTDSGAVINSKVIKNQK